MSIQSIEDDLWIFMGTTTIFEKGGWLIAVTGMMQIIAVIVNNIAIWTTIVVMYIIVTLENGIHDNDDSSTSNVDVNDSNCLHHTSDSNESSSFLKDSSSAHEDSKVA